MKKVFEPVNLRGLQLKNRLIRSATWEGIAETDGGSTENRSRILLEILSGVKKISPNLHVTLKINCNDLNLLKKLTFQ